jgi:proton glutamate symport protein
MLTATGLASMFGGPPLAIPFLFDLLQLPQDLFQLFVTVDVLASRFGTLLAAMHIVTIALVGTFALHGRVRLRLLPLARFIGITIALLAIALIGIRVFYTYVVVAPFTRAEVLRGFNPWPTRNRLRCTPSYRRGSVRPARNRPVLHRSGIEVS